MTIPSSRSNMSCRRHQTRQVSGWSGFPEEGIRDVCVYRLANLVLLSRKKNSEAQNFDFETKKEKYFKSDKGVSPFVLTTQVLAHLEWTPEVLQTRQDALLEKIKEHLGHLKAGTRGPTSTVTQALE